MNGVAGPILPMPETARASAAFKPAWTADGEGLVVMTANGLVWSRKTRTLEIDWFAYHNRHHKIAVFSGSGRLLRHTSDVLDDLAYLVERADGRIAVLSYDEFEAAKATGIVPERGK